jgi:hypothetical protein
VTISTQSTAQEAIQCAGEFCVSVATLRGKESNLSRSTSFLTVAAASSGGIFASLPSFSRKC